MNCRHFCNSNDTMYTLKFRLLIKLLILHKNCAELFRSECLSSMLSSTFPCTSRRKRDLVRIPPLLPLLVTQLAHFGGLRNFQGIIRKWWGTILPDLISALWFTRLTKSRRFIYWTLIPKLNLESSNTRYKWYNNGIFVHFISLKIKFLSKYCLSKSLKHKTLDFTYVVTIRNWDKRGEKISKDGNLRR